MRKLALLVAVGALASLGLAACGGGGGGSSTASAPSTTSTTTAAGGGGGKATTVDVSSPASSALAFDQKSLSAKAGSVTFDYNNPAPLGHNFCVKDSNGQQVGCTGVVTGSTSTVNIDLKAGQYTFYCSVDGHEAAGMEGTLTVK